MRPSSGLRHQPAGDPVIDGRGIHPILPERGVDEDHCDGGVPLRRIGHGAAIVPGEMSADPFAERVVVGDRHGSDHMLRAA